MMDLMVIVSLLFLCQLRDVRKAEQASNPYYVKSSSNTNTLPSQLGKTEDIPIESIYMNVPLKIQGTVTFHINYQGISCNVKLTNFSFVICD